MCAQQAEAPADPGQARIQEQIDEPGERRQPEAARAAIAALLPHAHRGVVARGDDVQRTAVSRPVAVGGVVKHVMFRPDVLRHPGQHAEDEAERLVETGTPEQAAVAALVHQHEHAQQEQGHQHNDGGGEPVRHCRARHDESPERRQRNQGRRRREESAPVVRPGMGMNDRALERLDGRNVGHRCPGGSRRRRIGAAGCCDLMTGRGGV